MNVIVVVGFDEEDEGWKVVAVLDHESMRGNVREVVDQLYGKEFQYCICGVQKVTQVEVTTLKYSLIKS
jgi:hypothetical protein